MSGMKKAEVHARPMSGCLQMSCQWFGFYSEGDWEPLKDFKLRDKIIGYMF